MNAWEKNVRQAVSSLNRILTRYNNWDHPKRKHIFVTRNLLADEWMMLDAVKAKEATGIRGTTRYSDITCSHGEPGEPERECPLRGKNRCRSCGFLFCNNHARQLSYSGAHVPPDEEYTDYFCVICSELDPFRIEY